MIRLLGSKDRRQLALIDIYQNEDDLYLTHGDLANRLSCTNATIKSDLIEIQGLFPDEIQVDQSGIWVNLAFKKMVSTNYYFKKFSQEAVTYRLLFELMSQSYASVEDLSQKIYVSRSSVYRAIKQINQFFEEANLELEVTTSPLALEGKEMSIRLFYPFILIHYLPDTLWPFRSISQQQAFDLYEILSSTSPYLKSFSSNPLVYLQIGLNFERFVNHFVVEKADWPITTRELSLLMVNLDIFTDFQAQAGRYPLFEVIPQVVPGLISSGTLLNRSYLEESTRVPATVKQSIADFEADMYKLKEDYKLQTAQEKDIQLISLSLYNLCIAMDEKVNVVLNNPITYQSNLVYEVACINPEFVVDVQSMIKKFIQSLNMMTEISDKILIGFTFYFIVAWPNTIFELNKIVKIDLLLYTGNYQYDLEYKAILDPIVHNYVTVHVRNQAINWQEILEESPYQIIMTTFDIPATPGRYIFNINSMPNVNTFLWIYETVRTINDSDTSNMSDMIFPQ
ncbi:helix-turn-helix domain-containing protein [Aerococcus sp. UMB8623]|uniref:helix-turn-helix domain-containing protein n=1 Tax=Aerococcus sp. UMB8623 TaxID=3046348 RepID=UPI00254CA57E|nr:helix-turn-helix domain-containing protein [Aerococcus sp. UMB8623]MDK6686854.1 helix-turn-helix domain-containing protein [Aerococcus sp. UMB8623]